MGRKFSDRTFHGRVLPAFRSAGKVCGFLLGLLQGLSMWAESRDLNPVLWGRWPEYSRGKPTAIACQGRLAVVAAGPGALHVIDVSDANRPRRVGGLSGEAGTNTSLRLTGGVAVLSGPRRGFTVADVRVPAAPRWGGTYSGPSESILDADARRVLVRTGSNQLDVVSIEDIDHPRWLGSVTAVGAISAARLAGDVAYLTDAEAGLRVLDLTQSQAPQLLPPTLPRGNASFEWMEFQTGVLIVYGHWTNARFAPRYAAVLVDVSVPLKPVLLGSVSLPDPPENALIRTRRGDSRWLTASIETGGEAALEVGRVERKQGSLKKETTAHGAHPAEVVDLAFGEDRMVLIDDRGFLKVFDISEPTGLVGGGDWSVYGEGLDYALDGNRAYLADGRAGVVAFDLKDPAEPRTIGRLVSRESWKRVLPVGDGTVVVLDGSSMRRRLRFSDDGTVTVLASVDFSINTKVAFFRRGFLYEEANGTLAVVDWRSADSPGKVHIIEDPLWPRASASSWEMMVEDPDGNPILVGPQVRKLNLDNPLSPVVSRRESSPILSSVISYQGSQAVSGVLPASFGFSLIRGTNLPFGPVETQRLSWFHPRLGGLLLTNDLLFVSSAAAIGAAPGESGHASVEVFRIGEVGALSRAGGCVLPEASLPPALFQTSGDLLHVAGPSGLFLFQLGATTTLERRTVFASETNLPPHLFSHSGVAFGDQWFSTGDGGPLVSYRLANGVVGERLREYVTEKSWFRAERLNLNGELIYVSYSNFGVEVFDASGNNGVHPLDPHGPLEFATDFKFVGTNMVATGRQPGPGFSILGLPTRERPRPPVISTLLEEVPCFGLAVTNTTAWIAAGAEGLIGVDFRSTTAPRIVGRVGFPGFATNVVILDGVAYVAARFGGIAAVDVRSANSPRLIARNGAVYADRFDYTPESGLVVRDFNGTFSEVRLIHPADSQIKLAVEGDLNRRVHFLRATGLLGRAGRIQRSRDGVFWFNWQPLAGELEDEVLEIAPTDTSGQQFYRFVEP